jgi:pimeloyl-ACP methyl ester carboxylesterase
VERDPMSLPITEHVAKSPRHTSFYLACGPEGGPPLIFVHGWPELSISWRHQLPAMGALGFRAIAPDMRGYGRSNVPTRHEDYAVEESTTDLVELLDSLGAEKGVFVGHDWGTAPVWAMASHHPDRCHGVANLCVPYIPPGTDFMALVDRTIYPADKFPVGQWDYQLFHNEQPEKSRAQFEANVEATVKALFRKGDPGGGGQPAMTAFVRANGGWFPGGGGAPDLPRDEDILTEEDLCAYAAALQRNGFFGPDSWYLNGAANAFFTAKAKNGGRIEIPTLFIHAAYDWICETLTSPLAGPMRAHCSRLSEATVKSGHWMAQEKPLEVNAILARWLAVSFPSLWPTLRTP